MQKFLTLLAFVFFSTLAFAQNRNWDKPMQLQKCSINVKADLFTATTFIEMEFFNPNSQEIEGLYRFQLLPGQAVTALQLDLFGKLRDGSIEEKWKAANAYNTIVGKRVDPALLQMDSYNSYSLRIYPVPAKGTRRITMTIQQMLKPEGDVVNYLLPITGTDKISEFKVDIAVGHVATKAFIRDGLLKGQLFNHRSARQELSWQVNDAIWEKPLSFSIPLPKEDVVCVKTEKEKTGFAVRHVSAIAKTAAFHPRSVAIYWDISFSGSKRDTEKEISFLKQYAAYYGVTDYYIIPFNYKPKAIMHFRLSDGNKWISYLRSLNYEGATQIGTLDFSSVNADAIFLVSDGYNSLGAAFPKNKNQTVFCLHASRMADNQTLNMIIGESGGKNIDLQHQTISEAIAMAGTVEKVLLNIRSASGKSLIDIEEHDKLTGISFLAGTTAAEGDTLFFDYGNNGRVAFSEKVVLRSSGCGHTAIARLPALFRFDGLLKKGAWQELLLFGKEEGIVTYNTSFIVLEKVEDYVRYNIDPPKELEEACERLQPGFLVRNRNQKREERLRQRQQRSQFDVLNAVAYRYNQRISNWGSAESIVLAKPEVETASAFMKEAGSKGVPGAGAKQFESRDALAGGANLSEVVVVTGYGTARRRQVTGSSTIVRGEEIFNGATTVEQALSGRVAGLEVTSVSGYLSPGNATSIRIRGASTLLNNSNPLFVLDGFPISGDVNGNVNINQFVSVNDIEQIEVLKDAGAMALYGSRGANGVILIKTRKGKNTYWYDQPSSYKLSSMEDVEYLQEIKAVEKEEKWAKYKELQQLHQDNAGFYLDMGQHLFESGFREEAKMVLSTAAEVLPNNLAVQRSIAFYLEQWGEWKEAIGLYESLLKASPGNPLLSRELALAYNQSGQHQKAVDVLYQAISYDNEASEHWHIPQKELLLNELNAIIGAHKDQLDLAGIPASLIKPLPVDLRIVVQGVNGSLYGVTVVESDGKECREWQARTATGGYFTQAYDYNYSVREYQIKQALKGRYKVRVRYHDDNGNVNRQPAVVKVTVYKNFGTTNQTVSIENVILDNQRGEIEIAETKF